MHFWKNIEFSHGEHANNIGGCTDSVFEKFRAIREQKFDNTGIPAAREEEIACFETKRSVQLWQTE